MSGRGVVTGLAQSAFLADLGARDKSFWRFVGTFVLGLLGGLAVGVIAGVATVILFGVVSSLMAGDLATVGQRLQGFITDDGKTLSSAVFLLTVVASINGPIAAIFIVIAAAFSGHRVRDYVTAAPRIRWRLLLSGMLLAVLVLAPVLAADRLFGGKGPPPPFLSLAHDLGGRALYPLAAVALLLPAAAAEEVLFRGWLLRQMGAILKTPWVLIVVNGLAFSALHLDFSPDAFLTRALMGAGFAYMTLRLGGIEFSTGAHAANNILIVLFIEPLTLKTAAASNISMGSLTEDLLLVAGYILITEAVARLPALQRLAGVKPAEISGGAEPPAAFS